MLERHAFAHPDARLAFRDVRRVASAQTTPRQNRLLAALPWADYQRLRPDLEPVALPRGWVIHRPGERERHLYFITAGLVSRFYVMESGASAEFALTGREGVIGVASFLGGGTTPSAAVVLSAGHAFRMDGGVLEAGRGRDGPLARLLLRYTLAMISQIGQIAVCNRLHSVEQQLCRWILLCLDRLPSNELAMTHELIAHMLGVRRESVSQAAAKMQREGLIQCGRGRIAVLDRPRLEARACECYEVVKRECDRLLPG